MTWDEIARIATPLLTGVLIPIGTKIWILVSRIANDVNGIHIQLKTLNGRVSQLEDIHPRSSLKG